MKYALLDFLESNEVDIVEFEWISNHNELDVDESAFDRERIVYVSYPPHMTGTGRKKQNFN